MGQRGNKVNYYFEFNENENTWGDTAQAMLLKIIASMFHYEKINFSVQ
jgi:hypothetical protein